MNLQAFLHFRDTNVVATLACRGVNKSVNIKSRAEMEFGGIVGREFLDRENLPGIVAEVIASCFLSANYKRQLRHDKLFVAVPQEFCTVTQITNELTFKRTRKITRKDVSALLRIQYEGADKLLCVRPICYRLDGGEPLVDPLGLSCERITAEISIFSCARYFVDTILEAVPSKWFFKIEFIPEILARALYFVPEKARDNTSLLIESGMFTTSCAVVRADSISFMHTFNIGLAHVISDLIEVLKTDFAVATRLVADVYLSVAMSREDNYEVQTVSASGEQIKKRFSAELVNDIIKSRLEMFGERIPTIISEELLASDVYIGGGNIDAISGARDFIGKLLGVYIRQCKCPFGNDIRDHEPAIFALYNYIYSR